MLVGCDPRSGIFQIGIYEKRLPPAKCWLPHQHRRKGSLMDVQTTCRGGVSADVSNLLMASFLNACVSLMIKATPRTTFDRLVNLYNRQPRLTIKDGVSMREQAFSTPMPPAYPASIEAGVKPEDIVYDPTAGNGALLIATDSRPSCERVGLHCRG